MAAVLGLLFAVTALASQTTVITGCAHQSQVRPHKIVIACGDGNFYVDRLAWQRWNARGAVAKGIAHQNDCKPNCARGHFHAYRATLNLSQVVSCVEGRPEFARIAWRLAATPLRAPHSGSQTLTCRFLRLGP